MIQVTFVCFDAAKQHLKAIVNKVYMKQKMQHFLHKEVGYL